MLPLQVYSATNILIASLNAADWMRMIYIPFDKCMLDKSTSTFEAGFIAPDGFTWYTLLFIPTSCKSTFPV